jgi:hypothetical protein
VTQLSALSNVRLDNFVYTLECIHRARELLAAGGGIVMYSMVTTEYVDLRLRGLVAEVFGEDPLIEARRYGPFNRIYMAGAAFAHRDGEARRAAVSDRRRPVWSRIELPRDDWPYLYLRRRGISGFYATLMATFVALAVLGVAAASEDIRYSLLSGKAVDGEMFLFGLAFMLLETRSVTEMALVWGVTWLTSAVVFGSILTMILLATLVAQSRPLSYEKSMAALVVSLLAAYVVPTSLLLVREPAVRLALSTVFVGGPIFFAASCFAILFRSRRHAALAFGWNLLGAVVGGLLEFVSMAVGLKSLLLVAMAAYLGATLVHLRRVPPGPEESPGSAGSAS